MTTYYQALKKNVIATLVAIQNYSPKTILLIIMFSNIFILLFVIHLDIFLNLVLTNTKIIVLVGTLLFYYGLERKYIKNIFTMLMVVINSTILTGVVFTTVPATEAAFIVFYGLVNCLVLIHIFLLYRIKNIDSSIIFQSIMVFFFLLKTQVFYLYILSNIEYLFIFYNFSKFYFIDFVACSKEISFKKRFIHTFKLYLKAPFTPIFWVVSCIITFLMIHYHIYNNISFAESEGILGKVREVFQYIINGLTFRYDIHSLPSIVSMLTISSGITYGFSRILFYCQKKKRNVSKTEDEDDVLDTSSTSSEVLDTSSTSSEVSPTSTSSSGASGSRFLNLYNWFDWLLPYSKVQVDKNYFFSRKHFRQQQEMVNQHKMLLDNYSNYFQHENMVLRATEKASDVQFKNSINFPKEIDHFAKVGPNETIRNYIEFRRCMNEHRRDFFLKSLRPVIGIYRKSQLWDKSIQQSCCIPIYPPTKLIPTPTGLQVPKGYQVIYEPGSYAKSYLKPTAINNMSLRKEITPLIEEHINLLENVYSRYTRTCFNKYLEGCSKKNIDELHFDDVTKLTINIIKKGPLADQFRHAIDKDDFYYKQSNLCTVGATFNDLWKDEYILPEIMEKFPNFKTVVKIQLDQDLRRIGTRSWADVNIPHAPDYCPESLIAKHYPVSTPTVRDLHQNPAARANFVPLAEVSELFN